MITTYVLVLGILLALTGSTELTFRERAFRFWMRWFSHRLFFLHGALLIVMGFPLTFYNGKWSTFVFITGLVMVMTGPFLLVYPEKFRNNVGEMEQQTGEGAIRGLLIFDAAVRVIVGTLLVYCVLS